jgi:antitoxin StbD
MSAPFFWIAGMEFRFNLRGRAGFFPLKTIINRAIFVADNSRRECMDTIYADYSISMSEFKKNPAQVLRSAGEKPVAVLNHNRPAFYMVTPKLFEALVEKLVDLDLVELVRHRLAHKDTAIEVDIDKI